ncbi:hypothetical protein [Ammoniphilus sp. CFH 90114]|uniref:hypothetical protein n=1 Tax=Ammoniphilus sp. CFH 90114 TaxID=2493665 RepID=UPI00100FFDCF|nr:hypothetical protein [Ammoniphilus sp. CFH 90114]RXT09089.1 hypothetical protein EIZ39_09960 [Ammoniphilus sp. CFH 90114]
MHLKLSKEDIFNSLSVDQLEVKRKYLLDTLFYSGNLSNYDRFEIHHLLLLIDYQKETILECV